MGALEWNEQDERWKGEIRLPLPFTKRGSRQVIDLYDLLVYDKTGKGPSAAQAQAFAYLQENKATICEAVRTWVFKYVQYVRESFDEPTLASPAKLTAEISCGDVGLHATSKNGCAFVVFGFECRIDEEHGINVVVHKNKILGIGSRDVHGFEHLPAPGWGFEALEDIK